MNNRKRIFLFGAGLHCSSCIDILLKQEIYEIGGIIDSEKEIGSVLHGFKVIGRVKELKSLCEQYNIYSGFISVGTNWVRRKIHSEIVSKIPEFNFINLIHPTAVFGINVKIGHGVFIGAQSFISSECNISDFCLIHQKSHLGLNNNFLEYSSISLGSLTGGKVNVGKFSAITIGCIIQDRITIGDHSLIGSGSLVLKNIPSFSVFYGNPAQLIRRRGEQDPYLLSS